MPLSETEAGVGGGVSAFIVLRFGRPTLALIEAQKYTRKAIVVSDNYYPLQ